MSIDEIYKTPKTDLGDKSVGDRFIVVTNYVTLVLGVALFLLFFLNFLLMPGEVFFQIQNMVFPLLLVSSSHATIKTISGGWRRILSVLGVSASVFLAIVCIALTYYILTYVQIEAGQFNFWALIALLGVLALSMTNLHAIYRRKNT